MPFCKSFFSKFKKLLTCVDDKLIKYVDIALTVTTKLKQLVESDTAELIVNLTPTNIDDLLLPKVSKALEFALQKLNKVNSVLNQQELRDFINWLKGQPEDIRDAYYSKIASLMSQGLDDARFKSSLYDTFSQARYIDNKKIDSPYK